MKTVAHQLAATLAAAGIKRMYESVVDGLDGLAKIYGLLPFAPVLAPARRGLDHLTTRSGDKRVVNLAKTNPWR